MSALENHLKINAAIKSINCRSNQTTLWSVQSSPFKLVLLSDHFAVERNKMISNIVQGNGLVHYMNEKINNNNSRVV